MSSTRYQRQQPLQIYQDPETYDQAPMPAIHSSSNPSSPLKPIKNVSSRRNIVFHPPASGTKNCSPHKPAHQSSSSPLRAPFSSKLKVVPMPPPGGPNNHTDSMEKKQPMMSRFKTGPQKALFTTFPTTQATGKENRQPSTVYCTQSTYDPPSQHSFPINGQKQQNKRVLLDAAPIEELRPSKKLKQAQEPSVPSPDQLPPLHDDGTKPGHSYATLIGMAILRAPNRRLTLAQIYKWISNTYSYYNAADAGWQNSIRHNLSLNKAFVKQERPKDDPGKGNYWAIEPGMEKQFFKDKQTKKSAVVSENVPIMSTTLAPSISREITQPPYKTLAPASQELPQISSFKPKPPSAPPCTELSSDATIPLSDAFNDEEQNDESFAAPQFYPAIQSSPPPMHSSPPVAHHVEVRDGTPPPVPRFPTSSRNRSHKRNFASMDDSGYFSSLNSSALRGTRGDRLLTSEADRPCIKRGRAEEEIARLRGSSYDSPTKARAFISRSASFAPASSSPVRRGLTCDSSQMLPPLTPAVKLKPLIKQPPQSVSPNTNLRMHRDRVRQLVGSPDRGLSCLEEGTPWSPAFNLEDTSFNDFGPDFDVYIDNNTALLTGQGGSPVKRSARRPRTDRGYPMNVLGDVSNKCRSITSTPMPKCISTPILASPAFESPSKLLNLESPSKFNPSLDLSAFDIPQGDFYGAEFLTEEVAEFSGLDILQGFQKIGAGGQGNRLTPSGNNTSSRPAFGRSFTSRF